MRRNYTVTEMALVANIPICMESYCEGMYIYIDQCINTQSLHTVLRPDASVLFARNDSTTRWYA